MIEVLKDFPIQLEIPVAWGEMDAFQHVNNLVYLRYFESARMAYMEACGYQAQMDEFQVGPILRDSSIRYKIPLTYPDKVISATRVVRVGEDRFDMEHLVYSQQYGKVAAEGKATIVYVDYKTGQKTSIPDAVKDLIMQLETDTPLSMVS